jgi:hypothetical protein
VRAITSAMRIIGRGMLEICAYLLGSLDSNERNRVYRACLRKVGGAVSREDRLKIYRDEMSELVEPEARFLIPSFEKGRRPAVVHRG